ncbi:hypothetical protein ACHAWF_011064 [Thalassiosira exigua]
MRPRERRRRSLGSDDEASAFPLDVRVMPVDFHGNGTFAARGVNKILRGRYRVKNGRRPELRMDVSLFGAGRSAPGEGPGLSHEDERSYAGEILASDEDGGSGGRRALFVRGSVVFGTDLGTDARPEPVGTFTMMEVRGDS